jgi:hypothetical protein
LLFEQLIGKRLFIIIKPLKNFFLRKVENRLNKHIPPHSTFVEERSDLTPDEFKKNYFAKSLPVIFKATARNWTCCQKWDFDYLKSNYGESDLLLVNADGLTSREDHSEYEFLTVSELVDNIKSGGKKYLRFSPLLENNPSLAQDLNLTWLQKMRGFKTFANTFYMFMGGKGQKTLLHTDQPCNLYVQIHGEKKWTLYSAKESILLYPEISNTAYIKSPVEIDRPDDERFPLFKYANPYTALLSAGDVLYIPPHTWHFVENLTNSISVGYRYSSARASLRSSTMLTILRLLATNPPIWKTIKYGKLDTNLIWAHANGKVKEIFNELEIRNKRKNDFSKK